MNAIARLQALIDDWDTILGHAGHEPLSKCVPDTAPQESSNDAVYSDSGHAGHSGHAKNDKFCVNAEMETAKREDYEERAAIIEYDGGKGREQAEEEAFRLVYCKDCQHWTPDDVNPVMGLGECAIRPAGTLPLPWPMNTCWRGELKEITT